MKPIIFTMLFVLAGCATENPSTHVGSLTDIKKDCITQKDRQIKYEWRKYEVKNWVEIHNGWRNNSRNWAKIECEVGRPIPQFHPGLVKHSGSAIR